MLIDHIIDNCTCEGKACTGCEEYLCIGKFGRDKRLKSGLRSQCKDCESKRYKEWSQTHKEYNRIRSRNNYPKYRETFLSRLKERRRSSNHIRERERRYWQANRERKLVNVKRYYNNHREEIIKRRRAYYQRNRDKILQRNSLYGKRNRKILSERDRIRQRRYREKYPEKYKELNSLNWQKYLQRHGGRKKRGYQDPIKHAIGQARRRARKNKAGGNFTSEEWEALKAQYDYRCLWCGKKEPEIKLHADHVIPIYWGGDSNITNIQPLCKSCNSRKRIRILDFRNRNG